MAIRNVIEHAMALAKDMETIPGVKQVPRGMRRSWAGAGEPVEDVVETSRWIRRPSVE